jgi:two-component system, OmpR family, alkaline phosphatase synthesis response regulator PhoP
MAKHRILVVDDEEDILHLVAHNLEREGYLVETVTTGEEAIERVLRGDIDLMVLDLMLPGINGLDVCRKLKNDRPTAGLPIVMLTARGEDIDVVTGLELGADDYVTKPFSPRVLAARVKAVLRREPPTEECTDIVRIHDLVIHPMRHEVRVEEQPVDLTATEFAILHFLSRRPGWVFTRMQIIDAVKGENHPVTDRSVDVQVVGLRKKLGDAGALIETVRGVGYRFKE